MICFYVFFSSFQPSAFSLGDLHVPQMANVLKVFLENGQTKSFKYDSTTSVRVSISLSFVYQFNRYIDVSIFIQCHSHQYILKHIFISYSKEKIRFLLKILRMIQNAFPFWDFTIYDSRRILSWIENGKLEYFCVVWTWWKT